jgi:hypothetical protein
MARIFISYRREGAAGFSGRLGEDLERRFGADEVFRDVEDITSGDDFVERLTYALRDCRVLLAVIDKTWLSASVGGRRRLDDPKDFVRTEIASALARGVRVIPVLVDGATMPAEAELPDDLKPFARRQAHEVSDSRWDYDIERLAGVVQATLGGDMQPSGSGTTRPRRRWRVAAAVVAALVAIAAVGWYGYSRPPDLHGTWDLPDGSYWIIQQSGRTLEIDVVHYQSRQVWQRGRGAIEGHEIAFDLRLVYQTDHRIEGRLRMSGDDKRLTGVAVSRPSGHRTDIILLRR